MIKLQGVSKYYKTKTGVSEGMRNINLDLNMNEFVAITGESGSGKTTLLNVISGLDSYEDGELYVNGKETSHYTVKEWEDFRAKNVGFVFQNYNVIDSYTVYQNVVIALEAQGYNESEKKAQALKLIERVGLLSHKNQKTAKLSGGQKQRVVIARALAKNAPIILADEPTGNLDEQSGKEIMELLKEISQDKLIILVTHNYAEAKPYVTRNIVMSDGNIKDDKPVNKNPFTPYEGVGDEVELSSDSFKTSFKIASRNVAATPKRTFFNVFISMISISIFIMFYSLLIKNTSTVSFSNTDKTVYVQTYDGSKLDNKVITNTINDYQSKNLDIDVSFGRVEVNFFTKDLEDEGFNLNRYETAYNIMASKPIDSLDIMGKIPQSKNEVVLPQYYNIEVGSKIYIIPLKYSNGPSIEINNYEIEFIVSGVLTYNYSYDYDLRETIMFHEDYLYDDNYNLNQEFFGPDQAVRELKVTGSDRQEIEIFSKKLGNKDFRIIDSYLVEAKEMEFVISTLKILFWAILIGILSIVFLVMFNIYKNVMATRKKDFAVYRSIGVSEREVAVTIILEQILIALIATVVTIAILEILGTQIEFVRTITRHISFLDYLVVSLVFALFSLVLGLRFNKRIFNITVIDSLKEDN